MDLITNTVEDVAQVAEFTARDLVRAAGGDWSFSGVSGVLKALRKRKLSEELEDFMSNTTINGEFVKGGGFGIKEWIETGVLPAGAFTLRRGIGSALIDYGVGSPLYFKGFVDTMSKRWMAQATVWEAANLAARRASPANRQAFFDEYFKNIPEDVQLRALQAARKAGFNRELTKVEERIAGSLGV